MMTQRQNRISAKIKDKIIALIRDSIMMEGWFLR